MRTLLVPVFVVLAVPAIAQDAAYPFSGYFAAANASESVPPATADTAPADLLARCAVSIVDQKADGSYTIYLIDRAAFRAGELAYRPVIRGSCDYDPATRSESCTSDEQAAALSDPPTFFDGVGLVTADSAQIVFFETIEDARAGANSTGYFSFFRCPVNETVVAGALKPDLVQWSEDEINAIRFPDAELLSSAEVKAIGETIAR